MPREEQIPLWQVISDDIPMPSRRRINATQSTAIWTEHKAHLIQRYLYYFVLVTRHGVYIDGFAGPHKPDRPETWAANLVISNEPRWLRKFYLFDKKPTKIEMLEQLRDNPPPVQSGVNSPLIEVRSGDFNARVHEILTPDCVRDTEATFCLLDQQTFECHWATVKALAEHKSEGYNKIELFYFFPQGWVDRALGGLRNYSIVERWWGNSDWGIIQRARGHQRSAILCDRFRDELGYKYAYAWPILARARGGRTMYTMIHATDHKDAPRLMHQAYREVVNPHAPPEQKQLELPDPEN